METNKQNISMQFGVKITDRKKISADALIFDRSNNKRNVAQLKNKKLF